MGHNRGRHLYARYLCSRDALGRPSAAGQARRATIGYLVYKVGIVGHVWVKVDIKRLKIAIGVYNWGKVGAQNADKIANINGAKSGHILRKTISLRKNN